MYKRLALIARPEPLAQPVCRFAIGEFDIDGGGGCPGSWALDAA